MINESRLFCDFSLTNFWKCFALKKKGDSFLRLGHIWIDLQGKGRSCIPHTKTHDKLQIP